MIPTFEGAPGRNFAFILLRAVFNRPTIVLLLRAHLDGHRRGLNRVLHGALLGFIGKSTCVLPLSIVDSDVLRARCRGVEIIVDPEFWDYEFVCPPASNHGLAEELRCRAKGRKILLVAGTAGPDKAIGKLAEMFSANPKMRAEFFPVIAGTVLPEVEPDCSFLGRIGFRINDKINDSSFRELFLVADFAWCAYSGSRDMSSGILGRCIQTGVIPIVRKGSVAETLALEWTQPVSIDHSNSIESSRALLGRLCSELVVPRGKLRSEGYRVKGLICSFLAREMAVDFDVAP